MMRRILLLSILVLLCCKSELYAQSVDSLTLSECYILVRQNAPQLKQLSIHSKEVELEQDKLSAANLPNLSAFGKGTYQSDAIAIPAAVPGAEPFALDLFQYNVGISLDQKLFDGGVVSIQKDLKSIEGEINNLETEIGLYKLNELVNKYFFGVLSVQKSKEILELKKDLLQERKKSLESGLRNGVVLQSDFNRINAELASTKQQLIETDIAETKLKSSLQILLGAENNDFKLLAPQSIFVTDSLKRYELDLFGANRDYIESATKLQGKRYIPKFYAYGQTGYSYPGLNMFENKSDYYYIVGVKMAWQIFDWNHSKKEVQLLNLKKNEIDISQSDFERNISINKLNQTLEIEKLRKLIDQDYEIVKNKEEITKASSSALKNGTITSVEYLSDLNSEIRSRFEMEVHKIELKEAQANLAVILGLVSQ